MIRKSLGFAVVAIVANGLYWLGAEPRLAPLSTEKQSTKPARARA